MATVDEETLQQVRERLRASTRVGDERIQVAGRNGDVVLRGAVATPEEVTVAGQLAEYDARSVVNELTVDRGLREEPPPPVEGERAAPPAEEELVGSTDMLAGPEAEPTQDMARALDENEPWSPPDVPQDSLTRTEERGGVPREQAAAATRAAGERDPDEGLDDGLSEEDRAAAEGPSAPDVSAAELRRAGEGHPLPALDPTAPPPREQPEPDRAADERSTGGTGEDMAIQEPGTAMGPGAVAESTTGGGGLGGTPALRTGATGADTGHQDPALGATGGTQKSAGTDPGPPPPSDEEVTGEAGETGELREVEPQDVDSGDAEPGLGEREPEEREVQEREGDADTAEGM